MSSLGSLGKGGERIEEVRIGRELQANSSDKSCGIVYIYISIFIYNIIYLCKCVHIYIYKTYINVYVILDPWHGLCFF